MMLKDEVKLFERLSGESANNVTIERIGSFLDGYFVGKEESVIHAHWIYKGKDDNDNGDWECSHCGCGETHSVSCEVPYCWKCGAKMDALK